MMTSPSSADAPRPQPQDVAAGVIAAPAPEAQDRTEVIGQELQLPLSDSSSALEPGEPTLIQQRKRPALLGDTFTTGHLLRGRYRLRHEIGRGGMGAVLAAHDERAGRDVAIKLLLPELISDEELVARFQREAKALAAIDNDNVCKLFDVGMLPSGAPFMVLERLYGKDLADVLNAEGRLAPARALDYMLQACRAVAAAHEAGVIHRDLKPENLFVAERADGTHCIKVLDFGLSKLAQPELRVRSRQLTADAQVMGTPCYMAPEQWDRCSQVGPASDQWALAAILFELITGAAPFIGNTVTEVYLSVQNRPTPSLLRRRPAAPRGLELVLYKALEKEPAARYADVSALATALAAFLPKSAEPCDDTTPTLPRRGHKGALMLRSDLEATRPRVLRIPPVPAMQSGEPAAPLRAKGTRRPRRDRQPGQRSWSRARILATAMAVATLVLGVAWAVGAARAETAVAPAAPSPQQLQPSQKLQARSAPGDVRSALQNLPPGPRR